MLCTGLLLSSKKIKHIRLVSIERGQKKPQSEEKTNTIFRFIPKLACLDAMRSTDKSEVAVHHVIH